MANKSYKIKDLEDRFLGAYNSQHNNRSDMTKYLDYYMNSVFYEPKKGEKFSRNQVPVNLMATFADKNIHFSCGFPEINVPTSAADPISRTKANLAEKLIQSVLKRSMGETMQKQFAQDGTLKSMAVAVTKFNFRTRQVSVKRYDPRYVFFTRSNQNSESISDFFIAFPVTKEEVKTKYGIDVVGGNIDPFKYNEDGGVDPLDGQEWTMQVIALDDEVRCSWVGETFIEKPHRHLMGGIPADICIPLPDPRDPLKGDFFLRTLVPLQAEINQAFKMRAGVVRKMGSPAIYAKGLYSRQLEEVLRALQGDGGLIGLKGQGELGVLAPPETTMIDNHIADLITNMMRIAGYGSASFGEATGANTSGDAYGMLFAPTTRSVDYQNISWRQFYAGICSKILYCFSRFYADNEPIKLEGYRPYNTLLGNSETENPLADNLSVQNDGTTVFTKIAIAGIRNVTIKMPNIQPVDQNAQDRLTYEMMATKSISRTTGFTRLRIESPEDELRLLEAEMSNPALNPEGMAKLATSVNGANNNGGSDVQQPNKRSATVTK